VSFLDKAADFIGGSLFGEIKDTVMAYFPPDMNPQERAKAELQIQAMLHAKQIEANKVLADAAVQLDRRISEQEGTAKDLLALPWLGRIVIFARGLQRPVWGFATLYMDHQWFFGNFKFDEQQQTAMIVINSLVLGFLFGERAMKNLEPLLLKVFAK
tara:strand:- start:5621 stop:6091 length:471 start_codon:yes stop_codon:yes gene_type:complete